jgi:hypothetical protein
MGKLLLVAVASAIALMVGRCSHPAPPAQLQAAEQATTTAEHQDRLDRAVATAGDRAAATAAHTFVVAQEAQHAVDRSQGADAPLAPDLLARFDAGVDRVWAPQPASPDPAAGAAGADPGDDRRAMPPAGPDGRADGR